MKDTASRLANLNRKKKLKGPTLLNDRATSSADPCRHAKIANSMCKGRLMWLYESGPTQIHGGPPPAGPRRVLLAAPGEPCTSLTNQSQPTASVPSHQTFFRCLNVMFASSSSFPTFVSSASPLHKFEVPILLPTSSPLPPLLFPSLLALLSLSSFIFFCSVVSPPPPPPSFPPSSPCSS